MQLNQLNTLVGTGQAISILANYSVQALRINWH